MPTDNVIHIIDTPSEISIAQVSQNCLFQMDVERLLDALPEEPIFDLVVTSPPYNIGKEYEHQKPLEEYLE